jgi:hypothetical protein
MKIPKVVQSFDGSADGCPVDAYGLCNSLLRRPRGAVTIDVYSQHGENAKVSRSQTSVGYGAGGKLGPSPVR